MVWLVFVSVFIFVFAAASNNSSDAISFLILAGSVFWMISYILAHMDVLILRRKLPKAPRSFKVPGGIIFPLIGIIGTVYMILNISTDPVERNMIWLLTGGTFVVLAMENDMYYTIRKKRGLWR